MFEWDGFSNPIFIGLANYSRLVQDEIFLSGIGRVLIWAVLAILFKVGAALVLANILRKPIKGSKFFTGAFFMPVIISSAALGLMFTLMYDVDIGTVNWILKLIGLDSLARPWLGDPDTAFYAVLSAPIFHMIGYFMIILLAAMKNIPEELYESAVIDGANAWTIFSRITIPLVWPILQICIILAINGAMKGFDYIFIMTKGGPGTSTEVPATHMYKMIFTSFQYGYGTSIAFSIFLFTITVVLVFKKLTSFKIDE